jgi:ubiquinone/menaquinone biosynthesis C-methylase UbiE
MFQKRVLERFTILGTRVALDIGCGVGGSSQILSNQFEWVIGVDIDLISLILAQKYIEEQGTTNVLLVCAYAQKLPVPDRIVDYAIAQNVLEHLFDVETALGEVNRILRVGGCFCGDSRNRYDLFFLEPHVKLRWVGFWPRKWQAWYVWQFRQTTYEHTQLLSLLELKRCTRAIFGKSAVVTFPYSAAYNRPAKWDRIIMTIEKIPLFKWLALLIFPSHLLIAQALPNK